jgi:hypothetical protein
MPATAQAVDAEGEPVEVPASAVPVTVGGEQIGALSAGAGTSADLLRDIAARAAPLVEVVRLRVELSLALREVEASRARLLRVGYEERSRLERDLHDGAQQRLVSLGMALRLTQRRIPHGGVDVTGVLDEAVAEIGTASGKSSRSWPRDERTSVSLGASGSPTAQSKPTSPTSSSNSASPPPTRTTDACWPC